MTLTFKIHLIVRQIRYSWRLWLFLDL